MAGVFANDCPPMRRPPVEVAKSWSHTVKNSFSKQHTWTLFDIGEVAGSLKQGESIESDIFDLEVCPSDTKQVLEFQLKIWPNGKDDPNFVPVCLVSKNELELDLKWRFQMVYGEMTKSSGTPKIQRFKKEGNWGFPKAVLHENLFRKELGVFQNNLKIICDLEVFFKPLHTSGKNNPNIDGPFSLSNNISKVFASFSVLPHSDVSLLCGNGTTIQCHKFILAARSPVFAAMFAHDMRESRENVVKMFDTEPTNLRNFIRFIYTDSVEEISSFDEAAALLTLAEIYDVEKLKMSCEEILSKLLNFQNIAKATEIATLYPVDILHSSALKFVIKNFEKLQDTPEMAAIASKSPSFILSVLKRARPPINTEEEQA